MCCGVIFESASLELRRVEEAGEVLRDPVRGGGGVGTERDGLHRRTHAVAGEPASRRACSSLRPSCRDVAARGARPGSSGASASKLLHPRAVGFERRQVGLGEVPVVERLLLRTQRVRRAGLLVEVPRLLDERLTVLERVPLPLLLEAQRAFERADRVEVLDLDLGAERGLARAPGRDVRVAAERPLLHPHVRDVERLERRAQLGEVGARLLGRAHVGFGHALDERHAGAVVVDEGVVGLPDPSPGAHVRGLARVLLHVDARDADRPALAVHLDLEPPADAHGQVVLADLVVLRHVGIEVVLPVEQRAGRDRRAEREPDPHDRLDRAFVRHRERARQAEADRADVRVRRRPERVAAPAEHLRVGRELDVALEPDHGLVRVRHDAPSLSEPCVAAGRGRPSASRSAVATPRA